MKKGSFEEWLATPLVINPETDDYEAVKARIDAFFQAEPDNPLFAAGPPLTSQGQEEQEA